MSRIYKKFYNRDLPIYAAEYWYRGEREFLPSMVNGATHFEPMFHHRQGQGVAIYYDINNLATDPEPMFDLFRSHPEQIQKIANDYLEQAQQLRKIIKNPTQENWESIYNICLESLLPSLSIMMPVLNSEDATLQQAKLIAKEARDFDDKAIYDAGEVLYQLAMERFGIDDVKANFVTHDEVIKVALPSSETIASRKKEWVLLDGKLYTDIGSLEDFCKSHGLLLEHDMVEGYEVKGTIANKGIVRGRVKVALTIDEANKIENGDILVTAMTTPDFIHGMRKAAAFVTDEGGVGCHAAIIAREMNKPCIIGTKNATSVLKDGMEVEVDAEKGVVRIINE
ncbi:MAG: PEP-utilizing enzyme [Patescibacteria group bacterium]